MRKLILVMIFLCLVVIGNAQGQRLIKGSVVSSEDKQPLMGVAVYLAGNIKIGTTTNEQGNFSLNVPSTAKQLVVSCIGFEEKRITITGQDVNNLTIVLVPDSQMLNDIVVTGYSTATKRSFVGSATVVNTKDLASKAVSNVSQALSGEVPGVTVINTSGQPGRVSSIYIRGIGSINGSTAPLYVVDGLPYDGDITSINPNDIKSLTVLKDATSTSIYGSRGANGVIVITTKSGDRGKLSINASTSLGVNMRFLPRYDIITSPEEYISILWQGLYQQGKDIHALKPKEVPNPILYANENLFLGQGQVGTGISSKYNMWLANTAELIDPITGQARPNVQRLYSPERWEDYAFQNSIRSESNISFSGGDSKVQYFGSIGYLDDKGYAKGSLFKRFTTRLNISATPYTWLNFGLNLNWNISKSEALGQSAYTSTNLFEWIDNIPPIYPLYKRDAKGERIADIYNGGYVFDFGESRPYQAMSNAVSIPYLDKAGNTYKATTLTGFANIKFLKYFTLENKVQATVDDEKYFVQNNKYYGQFSNQEGRFAKDFGSSENITGLNLFRFKKMVFKHSIEAFVAHEFSSMKSNKDYFAKTGIVDPSLTVTNNALKSLTPPSGYKNELSIESYFGQVSYDYDNKYFASVTFRRDGSSRFIKNKWGNFYSIGAGWMLSNEKFMQKFPWVKELKIKSSYGTLGSQGVSSLYPGYDMYSMTPNGDSPSFTFTTKGNPNLTWEKSSMFQVGLEFNLWNRLEGSIDFYRKVTTDMLYQRRVAPSNGYVIFNVNDATLLNQGIDFSLTTHLLRNKNYFIDLSLNGGYLHNEILKMALDPSTGKPKFIDESISAYARAKGHSLYDHYTRFYMGVDPKTGNELYKLTYIDKNANGKYDKQEEIVTPLAYISEHPEDKGKLQETTTTNGAIATKDYVGKSALPKLRGAFTIKGSYKALSLSMQFLYALGGYGYDNQYAGYMQNSAPGTSSFHKDFKKRWTKPGDVTSIPKYNAGLAQNKQGIQRISSSRFLISSSYLALNNVKINFDASKYVKNKLGISTLNLFVSGDNIAVVSARKGYNPMSSLVGATDSMAYKPLTTFTLGLNIGF